MIIIWVAVCNQRPHMVQHFIGIAKFLIDTVFQRYLNDVVFADTFVNQVFVKDGCQQEWLAATPRPCYHLDESVLFGIYQLLKVCVSFYRHTVWYYWHMYRFCDVKVWKVFLSYNFYLTKSGDVPLFWHKKPEIVSVINSFAFLQSWEAEAAWRCKLNLLPLFTNVLTEARINWLVVDCITDCLQTLKNSYRLRFSFILIFQSYAPSATSPTSLSVWRCLISSKGCFCSA